MRTVTKIDHPKLDVSIFLRENKYIVKIVLDQYEQVYRLSQADVMGMDDMEKLVSKEFLDKVYMRFVEMSKDFAEAFRNINLG
ncbi:MAG: hypothetical protein N4A35_12470 [Flavobacteriales bacterium]|jgi:hypothetical protein|nr:hypothetical protein [Flavobacteriales bacterium]